MIKFEKIEPGMVLYDRHKYTMGNTTIRAIGEWTVRIISVDQEKRTAVVSWNGNPPETYLERDLRRLSTWSMRDHDVEINNGRGYGAIGNVWSVKKKRKVRAEKGEGR